jgi:hypothetical protein
MKIGDEWCDGGLLHSLWGSAHCYSVGLTFFYSIYTRGGEHVVVKGSSSDGNEVMMGTLHLGDEDGLGINVGNNCVGVVGKYVDPPRNQTDDSNSMSKSMWTTLDSWIQISSNVSLEMMTFQVLGSYKH